MRLAACCSRRHCCRRAPQATHRAGRRKRTTRSTALSHCRRAAGLDVITDGEMRRRSWVNTVPFLDGIEVRNGLRSYPTSAAVNLEPADWQFVVAPIQPKRAGRVAEEYPYLAARRHTRTKYTMAAPSYHRRYWSDELSTGAYEDCEAFLTAVRDYLRTVASWLVEQGCDYIQLDAPNYGSLCDPATRAWHESVGHDLQHEIAFDGALDSSVFDGLPDNVTRALHICRGNQLAERGTRAAATARWPTICSPRSTST